MSGTRMNNGTVSGFGTVSVKNPSHRYRSPGAIIVDTTKSILSETMNMGHEPRLAIIDFNQLTRGGLDIATGKNRAKIPSRSPERYGKFKR